MAHVFMIGDGNLSGFGRDGRMDLADQLLARLIHADHGKAGIVGQPVNVQDIFHRRDKSGVPVGRDLPVFAQMRLQLVFFSERCTVITDTASTILSSTSLSAKRRTVQRW